MSYLLFANNSEFELEGLNALFLSNLDTDAVLFRVGGFKKQSIQVKDYRPAVVHYTRKMLLESEPVYGFAPLFNASGYLKIWLEENGRLLAEIYPAVMGPSRFQLWISTACGNEFPHYRYRLFQKEALGSDRNALFCIYKRPHLQPQYRPAAHEGFEVSNLVKSSFAPAA